MKDFIITRLVAFLAAFSISSALDAAITVDSNQASYLLGNHIEFLEEKDSTLSLADVMSAQQASRFQRAKGPIPNFGQVNSAFWFKIKLNHQMPEQTHWLLELDFPYIDHLEFYAPDTSGRYTKVITGDNTLFPNAASKHIALFLMSISNRNKSPRCSFEFKPPPRFNYH